jgi:hypothetical protein
VQGDDILFVKGEVPASMRAVFYEVLITFKVISAAGVGLPSYLEILEVHCSCVAGNASCHHGVALGLFIVHMTALSPTSRSKEWGAVKVARASDGTQLNSATYLRYMKIPKGNTESLIRGRPGASAPQKERELFKLNIVTLKDGDRLNFIARASKYAKTSVAGAKYVAAAGDDDDDDEN